MNAGYTCSACIGRNQGNDFLGQSGSQSIRLHHQGRALFIGSQIGIRESHKNHVTALTGHRMPPCRRHPSLRQNCVSEDASQVPQQRSIPTARFWAMKRRVHKPCWMRRACKGLCQDCPNRMISVVRLPLEFVEQPGTTGMEYGVCLSCLPTCQYSGPMSVMACAVNSCW